MGLFKKKEKKLTLEAKIEDVEKPYSENQEKKMAEEYRQRTEQILSRVQEADIELRKKIRTEQGNGNTEKLEKLVLFSKGLGKLQKLLEDSGVNSLDTVFIDKKICKMGDQLKDAIHNDNMETASRIIAGMGYGIEKARDRINSTEEIEEILESREEMLGRYEVIIKLCKDIDAQSRQIAEYDKKIDINKNKLIKLKDTIKLMEKNNPSIIQDSQTLTVGTAANPLVSQYMSLKGAGADQFNNLKDIKLQKTACITRINTLTAAIDAEKLKLQAMENKADEELMEEIRKSNESFRQFQEEQMQITVEMNKMNKEIDKIMDALFSSRQWVDMLIENDEAYNEMIEDEKERREADEEGRKHMLEEEEELEDEVENDSLLN